MGTHAGERERYVREFVMVEQARLRARMEAAIEAMLAMLDELEGDVDLEPDNDDEPSLGWCDGANVHRYGTVDDREVEDEHDEDGHDREADDEGDPDQDLEPALGWNAEASQAHLMGAGGAGVSGEEDEPSLGAPEGIEPAASLHWDGYRWTRAKGVNRFRSGSQEHWAQGASCDEEDEFDGREPDPDHEIEHEGGDDTYAV